MNRKTKRIILILIAIIVLFFIIFAGWVFSEFARLFRIHNEAARLPAPGTPAAERYYKSWERVTRESEQLEKAMDLEKKGQYGLAIEEYKKTLEMVKVAGMNLWHEKDCLFATRKPANVILRYNSWIG
jgi:hypothetical protein